MRSKRRRLQTAGWLQCMEVECLQVLLGGGRWELRMTDQYHVDVETGC